MTQWEADPVVDVEADEEVQAGEEVVLFRMAYSFSSTAAAIPLMQHLDLYKNPM